MIFTSLITISSFLTFVQFGGAVCRNSGDYEGVLDFHTLSLAQVHRKLQASDRGTFFCQKARRSPNFPESLTHQIFDAENQHQAAATVV